MEAAINIGHALALFLLAAALVRLTQIPGPGLRWTAAAVFSGAAGPLSVGAAQLLDVPAAAYLRWIALPSAFALQICLSFAMLTLFRTAVPRWIKAFQGAVAAFALIVTLYFYSDTYGREPVLNAFGIWDFPPGAGTISAGVSAAFFTMLLLPASFAPLLRVQAFSQAPLLIPGGLLLLAAFFFRGILTVRTFADDPHSPVLAFSSLGLSIVPLVVFTGLAAGLQKRYESHSSEVLD